MDHAPPPPYSETDVYSSLGTATSTNLPLTPTTSSYVDSTSVAGGPHTSTASSVGEVIYTPPYSPAASVHQNHGLVDNSSSSTAAAAYFESRPVTNTEIGPPNSYNIQVGPTTAPKDLPYPESFPEKGITDQDWATFLNYLLPDHIINANHGVADRKLRAEFMDESVEGLAISADEKSRADISHVDAQLESLRIEQSAPTLERLGRLDATISEWNDGFFKPRGLRIVVNDMDVERPSASEIPRIPGAWIPYDHELLAESSSSKAGRKGFFGGFSTQNGFRMGPIVADDNGFRIGKNGLVADANGFRMGNLLVADQNGFRLGGSRGFVADVKGVTLGGRPFGRPNSNEHERGRWHRDHHDDSCSRGQRHKTHERSSSTHSSSTANSTSAETDSSVDSLPEFDDLNHLELPAAKQSLISWLRNIDQPITKNTVLHMQRDIRAGTSRSSAPLDQDLDALKQEVRDLMKKFKEKKRAQKKERRQQKRERRTLRKGKRAERRNARREGRRDKCKVKRSGKNKEQSECPSWMASSSHSSRHATLEGAAPPIPPRPGTSPSAPGFPFIRAASVPFIQGHHLGRRGFGGPPGMHGAWPLAQFMPPTSGSLSVPDLPNQMNSTTALQNLSNLHAQALKVENSAGEKEEKAFILRTNATAENIDEKARLKFLEEAMALEEEAEQDRRESERLKAEALHLDSEIAREMEDQDSGIIQN